MPSNRYLTLDDVQELRETFLYAQHIGAPLNTFLTVNFNRMGIWPHGRSDTDKVTRARSAVLGAIRDWCKRQHPPIPHAIVWVLENASTGGKGPHMHVLLHLPVSDYQSYFQALHNLIRDRIIGCVNASDRADLDRRTAIYRATGDDQNLPFVLEGNDRSSNRPLFACLEAQTKLAYCCKGLHPAAELTVCGKREQAQMHARFGTIRPLEGPGDPLVCKTHGVSSLIGTSARSADPVFNASEAASMDWLNSDQRRRAYASHVTALIAPRLQKETAP